MQFIVIVSYSLILAVILWFGNYYNSSNAQTMENELDVNNVNSKPFEKEEIFQLLKYHHVQLQ